MWSPFSRTKAQDKISAELQDLDQLRSLIAEIRSDYRHTPDIRILEQRSGWNLFVYNEWKFGLKDHKTFMETQEASFLAAAFTERPYVLWRKKDLGNLSYPVILGKYPEGRIKNNLPYKGKPARVKGELYHVKTSMYPSLDRVMENGVQFKRTRVAILVVDLRHRYNNELGSFETQERITIVPAFMYVGIPAYWDKILDCGYSSSYVRLYHIPEKRSYSQHKIGDYYSWTKLEENDF